MVSDAEYLYDRPELGLREGYLPPRDLPKGDCIVTRLDDGSIRVDHADPRVLISAELLDLMADDAHPRVTLTMSPGPHGTPYWGWEDATLRIEGVNQTVIYCIKQYIPAVHGYVAEWPD